MAQFDPLQPTKTFRGTLEEVLQHRNEIPSGATVELRVYTSTSPSQTPKKTLAERILEIGVVAGLPPDLSTNPAHLEGFGELSTENTNK